MVASTLNSELWTRSGKDYLLWLFFVSFWTRPSLFKGYCDGCPCKILRCSSFALYSCPVVTWDNSMVELISDLFRRDEEVEDGSNRSSNGLRLGPG
jgi:hypothetical protein